MSNKYVYGAIGFLLILAIAVKFASAAIQQTDNTAVAAPTENGTSTLLNVTTRMQQYVGFFGHINTTVRLNTNPASAILYTRLVTQGKIYFFKAGATPQTPFTTALNNTATDNNFALTGYYVTGNHYMNNGTICGQSSTNFLNTTDQYGVGIFKDAAFNYFVCSDIVQKTSTNGFGSVGFEVIVPKTSNYTSYDVWIDLE
ncbi:hypothetical protein HY989_06020 [Candidatus Micrarchaeota archaeon]|nr:hypothetical protein [Candidatus Micrarchaeota archaeon]